MNPPGGPPAAIAVDVTQIPAPLQALRQWVVWRWTYVKEKWTKPPYSAATGRLASSTDPSTWSTFKDAIKRMEHGGFDGIGFVLTAGDEYVGVDLDHCHEPYTGVTEEWALDIVKEIDSYTEISPSGRGLRIIARGALPPGRRKDGDMEMYDAERYLTLTGHHLAGSPTEIEQRTGAIAAVHLRVFPPTLTALVTETPPVGEVSLEDVELLRKAYAAKNGSAIKRLYEGDTSGYSSQSEADLALCSLLGFYAPNPSQLDRLFRASGLYRPKWDELHGAKTYGQGTIEKALSNLSATYSSNSTYPANRDGGGGDGDSGSDGRGSGDDDRDSGGDGGDAGGDGDAHDGGHGDGDHDERPPLDAGDGDLPRMSRMSWQAILAANDPPVVFQQAGSPAWIEFVEGGSDERLPVIRQLSLDKLRFHLARVGDWYKAVPMKGGQVNRQPSPPPMILVRDLMADPAPPLPVLTRIVEAPVFGPNGSLNLEPGYHPSSRTYYIGNGFEVTPGSMDVINELLYDFPFTSPAERAHAIALMILPFVRDMIAGPTPLHLIEKPTPGTGGSLLAEMLTYPALGRMPTTMTEGRDEDEWRKRITARLAGGPSVILIDNLKRRLEASALEAAITSSMWEDRVLGRSETIKLPVRCAWVATGNNPALSAEAARRTVRIRLDARQDRPWERSDFRHPDIRRWAATNRGEIVGAIVTMVQNWLDAGRPKADSSLGSFEAWAGVIGGILMVNNIHGFLDNATEFYNISDEESVAWRTFVQAWWDQHGTSPVGVGDLWPLVASGDIAINLGQGSERSQRTRLGKEIGARRDRQFGALRIRAAGVAHQAKKYRLEGEHE